MSEQKPVIDYRGLSKRDRRKIRISFMRNYEKKMRRLGMPERRVQLRTIFDRAVAEGKLQVTGNGS